MTCARGLSAALAVRCVGLPSYHSCLCSESERADQPIEDIVREATAPDPLFISRLSGFAARCGGRDLAARRVIDQAVYDLRLEISEAATKLADQRGEPALDDDAC